MKGNCYLFQKPSLVYESQLILCIVKKNYLNHSSYSASKFVYSQEKLSDRNIHASSTKIEQVTDITVKVHLSQNGSDFVFKSMHS